MAEALFFPLAVFLMYGEERHGGGGGELPGEAFALEFLIYSGFGALTCAVGLASWPLRKAACELEAWAECFLCLELLLLLLLGLGQLFLYVAVAVGVAARRGLRGLAVALARVTAVLVLVAVAIAANCV